jgi:pyrimidine operon attenuation protein/uracil phosphoribosyltransferase
MTRSKQVLDKKKIAVMLKELADQIAGELKGKKHLVLIGIRTRGAILAQRIQELLKKRLNRNVPLGILDITLYRDDLSALGSQPVVKPTTLPFDVTGTTVVLVDDVLFTGRTVRAALDQIVDFGRPACVKLAVLIDRGLREYPIQPDFVASTLQALPNQLVQLHLQELDGEERVMIVDWKKR